MRYFWLVCLLTLAAGRLPAAEPEPARPGPNDEPMPAVLKKVTLTLDAGGHTAVVTRTLFTPDGKQVVTLSADHTVRIWDLEAGRTLRVLHPPGVGGLGPAVLSADGRTLALASLYPGGGKLVPVIYLLDLADGTLAHPPLKGHTGPVRALALRADGKRLASGGDDGSVRVWDLAGDGKSREIFKDSYHAVGGVALSPDGGRVLVHIRDASRCWVLDAATGKTVAECVAPTDKKFLAVAWSPDGKTLATAGADGLLLWEPEGKQRLHQLADHWLESVAFSGDSRRVLVTWNEGSFHRATVCAADTGKEVTVFRPDQVWDGLWKAGFVRGGALSPDGRLAATSGGGKGVHETFVWRTDDGSVVRRLAARPWLFDPRWGAGWSTDGTALSWGQGAGTWDRPGAELRTFHLANLQLGPHLPRTAFQGPVLEHGPLALKTDKYNVAAVWQDGKPLASLKLPGHAIKAMTFAGPGRVVLTDDWGPGFFLYGAASGNLRRRFLGHRGEVWSVAPSPDSRYLLSTSVDQTLRIWDPNRDTPLLSLYLSGNDWVVWTEEGYYAATPGGERLVGWTVDNGIDNPATFYPLERFRKRLYRPDLIKLVLEKGSVAEALQAVKGEAADVEKLLPPRATLEVVDKTGLPKVKVKATARAQAKGQPVTSLRLLVDGRPLPDGQGMRDFGDGRAEAGADWEVTLPSGAHELKVLARSPDAAGTSAAVPVDVPRSAKERPTLHLLAVGIDKYQAPGLNLDFAAKDAGDLAGAFRKHCAGDGNLFGRVEGEPLLDAQATRTNVRDALGQVRQRAKAGDLVVMYFAGHGVKEGKDFYLLTRDANPNQLAGTALSGKELRRALGDMPCQVLLILDACHAAAGIKAFKPATDDAARELTDDECGVAVLCAAMGTEYAQEKDGNGLFTKALVQALSRTERVPYNYGDGRQYVHHLHAFVFDQVQADSGDKQHPFLNLPWVTQSFPVRRLVEPPASGR